MTPSEIVNQAVAKLESKSFSAYSRERVEAKAAAGLAVGDAIYSGSQRLVYIGGRQGRMERQVGQDWQAERTVELSDAQMDALLVQAAADAGQLSTHVGR